MPLPPNSGAFGNRLGATDRTFADMLLPSFYRSQDADRPWNPAYAALCGAGIGAVAGLLKTVNPFRVAPPETLINHLIDIAVAALGFALLCAAAAALRNFIARHLIWDGHR